MTQAELWKDVRKIADAIAAIERASKYEKNNDLSGLAPIADNPEARFLQVELTNIMDKLDRVRSEVDYLSHPIIEAGILTMNEMGRYELPSGYTFTSGIAIEVLLNDEETNEPTWTAGSIEHDGTDYYFTGKRNIPLQGLTARRRGHTSA